MGKCGGTKWVWLNGHIIALFAVYYLDIDEDKKTTLGRDLQLGGDPTRE